MVLSSSPLPPPPPPRLADDARFWVHRLGPRLRQTSASSPRERKGRRGKKRGKAKSELGERRRRRKALHSSFVQSAATEDAFALSFLDYSEKIQRARSSRALSAWLYPKRERKRKRRAFSFPLLLHSTPTGINISTSGRRHFRLPVRARFPGSALLSALALPLLI